MAEEISKPEQRIYDIAAREHISYEEACRLAIDGLLDSGVVTEEMVVPSYEEALRSIQKRQATEAKGMKESWYDTTKPDTPIWSILHEELKAKIGKEGASTIHRESNKVVGFLADPNAKDLKRKGLVVGYVQSGKTANFSAVIAKAVDEGYRFVIVLAGMYNNLRRQTQERLDNDVLSACDEYKGVRPLTDVTGDISWKPIQWGFKGKDIVFFAVVKKNSRRLENLLHKLEVANKEGLLDNVPVLIIDDESDQATPNTAKEDEEYSSINRLLRQIWDQVSTGSYVAYTATPFANVLMNPDDEERYTEHVKSSNSDNPEGEDIERYPGLYPSDFIYALEQPKGYVGASRIFGTPFWASENADGTLDDGLDIDAVRPISEDDAKVLRPPTAKEAKEGAVYAPKMVSSLEDAVLWFMIATALRRRRAQKKQHSSMLIHFSQRVEAHFEAYEIIKNYISELQENYGKPNIDDAMQSLYEREVVRMQAVRPEAIYPEWDELKPAVYETICETKCIVENGSSEERLEYIADSPATYVVVGGNTLARGLTLEGLISSYYIRTSKTYDTLLQMGRWFGFRPMYEDLIRLWTTGGIQSYYRHLAGVEEEIREEIRRKGNSPKTVGVKIRTHPGVLQVTAPNKMRHAKVLNVDFTGKLHQLTRFDEKNAEVLNRNIQVFESLVNTISGSQEALRGKNNGSYLFTEVPVEIVLTYLKDFEIHPSHNKTVMGKMVEWIGKYVDQDWNVIIYSGTRKNMIQRNFAGLDIRMANRSAEINSEPWVTDLGALTVAGSEVVDLKILADAGILKDPDKFKNVKEKEWPALRYLNGNTPLLVIYVVNPQSPSEGKAARRDLDATAPVVLHAVLLPQVAGSGDGHFVAVETNNPEPDEEEQEEDNSFLDLDDDNEGDYDG